MKQTIKTGFAALLLLLAISCKKENSSIKALPATDNSSTEALSTDIDGVASNSIRIGTQVWRTINLNLDHYKNGDPIPQVKNNAAWAALTTGAWCYYNNDSATGAVYGKLYNWYAVNDPRGLTPAGWHIPSDLEWDTLSRRLGGDAVAGGKMKETGTTHWWAPNTGATNSSGFTGLPGGYRHPSSYFLIIGLNGFWWSATEYDYLSASYSYLSNGSGFMSQSYNEKQTGFSVRCIKD